MDKGQIGMIRLLWDLGVPSEAIASRMNCSADWVVIVGLLWDIKKSLRDLQEELRSVHE